MIDVIANRYAEALFQIGEEENKIDRLYNELKEVSSLITTNKELNNVMKSPLVSKSEKIQLVDALFAGKVDNDLKNFFKVLIEKGRINSLKAIETTYKELLNEKNNILEGYVISAVPMSDVKIKELEGELSKKYNKNVTLENKVDKSVLGGVLVRLGNTEIDGTIKTRLDGLKDQLSQVIS
ncbi:F0F1 ATP synthase subunit delta [Intestinibacter sp.]|uniref:F0F1 ATP synthase subunit delta n=1 Tax=Intestinibacter sp. TaxID=1965304 RepID=UPI003F18A7B1